MGIRYVGHQLGTIAYSRSLISAGFALSRAQSEAADLHQLSCARLWCGERPTAAGLPWPQPSNQGAGIPPEEAAALASQMAEGREP